MNICNCLKKRKRKECLKFRNDIYKTVIMPLDLQANIIKIGFIEQLYECFAFALS